MAALHDNSDPLLAPVGDGLPHLASRLRGRRVLVVDDDQALASILVRRLIRTGFDAALVETVTSGAAAVVAVSEREFLAIFVDWRMPGMDGLETTRRLREVVATAPIIGCTSEYSRAQHRDYLDAGADECVAKPVSQWLLDALILRQLAAA